MRREFCASISSWVAPLEPAAARIFRKDVLRDASEGFFEVEDVVLMLVEGVEDLVVLVDLEEVDVDVTSAEVDEFLRLGGIEERERSGANAN